MADYYVDASAATDGLGGTTEATAKKWFRTVLFFLTRQPNQNVWLRAGRYYDVDVAGNGLPSVQVSHVKFRPYGDLSLGNPCIDLRNWIAPGSGRFFSEGAATGPGGGFVWSLQIGTGGSIPRVWAGAVNNGVLLTQRTMGEALRRIPDMVNSVDIPAGTIDTLAHIKGALREECPWYGAGSGLTFKLYMWTKTNTDPADYYGGLAFTQSGAATFGSDYGFNILNAQDVLIDSIDVMASRAENFLIQATDTGVTPVCNIRVMNSKALGCFTSGFRVRQTTTATGIANAQTRIFDVLFKNCIADTGTSAREQEPNDLQYRRLSAASDLFCFFGRIENVRAEDCVSINGFHCGATFGAFDANSSLPRKTGFRRHRCISAPWASYTRGYTTFGCEDSCFIDQSLADGMNVRSQFSGSPLITAVKWVNSRASIRKLAESGLDKDKTDGAFTVESYIFDGLNVSGIGNERYVYLQPVNIRMYNCSIGPTQSPPIQFNAYGALPAGSSGLSPAVFAAGTVKIKNLLITDTSPDRVGQPSLTTYVETAMTDQVIDSCAIYKSSTEVPTVAYRGTTYPATAAPGFTSILTADPVVSSDLRPQIGSPLVAQGVLLQPVAFDFTGRQRPLKRPTIGAHEDFKNYSRTKR